MKNKQKHITSQKNILKHEKTYKSIYTILNNYKTIQKYRPIYIFRERDRAYTKTNESCIERVHTKNIQEHTKTYKTYTKTYKNIQKHIYKFTKMYECLYKNV